MICLVGPGRRPRRLRRARLPSTAAFAAFTAAITLSALAMVPGTARAQELILNGGFETGNLAGWTTTDIVDPNTADNYNPPDPTNLGSFTLQGAAGTAPFSGVTTLGPSAGSFYALADMSAPGEHALYQSFTVPTTALSLAISFDLYNYDWAGFGGAVDPSGLDYTTGGTGGPNQHVRVDLLSETLTAVGAFTTDPAAIFSTFYGPGVDPEAEQSPPQSPFYRTGTLVIPDASALRGLTVTLRFAEVDNQAPLSVGVDNVSVFASDAPLAAAAPEPGALALLLLPVVGAGLSRLRLPAASSRRSRRHSLR